ncbi:MAG: response regulator [Candidatus Omnitrophota bacterium]|nr:response regulator [Candidatus Omnitrophota bacterium]
MGKATLLVIDDTKATLASTQDQLKSAGYVVEGAESSKDAVELAKSMSIDLIYNKIAMPEFDGVMLSKKIKKALPKCLVVFVPADAPGTHKEDKHVMVILEGQSLAKSIPFDGDLVKMTEAILKGDILTATHPEKPAA